MNSTDNPQSTDKKSSDDKIENVKVYTSFTVRTNKDRLSDHIKECIHHIQKDIQLQNNTKMKEEFPEQVVRDSKD